MGLFDELGPFKPTKKGKLLYNPFTWTKFANIVFVEQPIGVGFSWSSKKEDFKTINPSRVGMYVCGPTVYNKVHLGNCRTFISFDLIVRFLKHIGYDVRYVRNITDVGHLEENAEEDKILKRAKIEKIEPMEVVQKYTNDFRDVLNKFNLTPPNIEPTATGTSELALVSLSVVALAGPDCP